MRPLLTLLALAVLCATALPAHAEPSNRSNRSSPSNAATNDGATDTALRDHEWDAAGKKREREKRLKMEAQKDEEIARLKKQLEREEEEEPDFHNRTLGRSCMYGADGGVLFRPAGGRCKGDRPPASPARAASDRKAAAGKVRTGTRRGRCFYGAENRVIYAPPGVDCRR